MPVHCYPAARAQQEKPRPFKIPNWPLRCSPAVRARGRPHGGHGCSHGGSLASRVNACTNKESQNGPCPNLLRPCCDMLTPFTDHQLVRQLLPNGKEPTKKQTPFKIPNKSLLCNPAAKAQGRSHGGPGCPTEVLGPRRYILRQVERNPRRFLDHEGTYILKQIETPKGPSPNFLWSDCNTRKPFKEP